MLKSMDRKISLLLFLLAISYLFLSFRIPPFPYALIDSDVLPKGLGFLLAVLSIILFLQSGKESESWRVRVPSKSDIKTLIPVLVLILGYITLFEKIGFVICTIVFLVASTRLLGYKKWKTNVTVAIIFTLGLYFSFNYLLKIYLPQGLLPF